MGPIRPMGPMSPIRPIRRPAGKSKPAFSPTPIPRPRATQHRPTSRAPTPRVTTAPPAPPQLLIGRRSPRRGIAPEIALDADDGISHRHARLRRRPDGGWEILDLGSANGTARNGAPVEPNVPAALQPGDRLRLGRWTELLVRSL